MRHTLLCILVLAFCHSGYAQEPTIDVQHYAFQLVLSDDNDVIRGEADIRIRYREDNIFTFDIDLIGRKGLSLNGMTVSAVLENDAPVTYVHDDDVITITPRSAPRDGEARTYTIVYEGRPADGLIIAENKYGDRTFFGDNWPNRARHWLPTVDHPSDKATVEFLVTAPAHYQVVSSGSLIEETDLLDGLRLTHWRTEAPLPTKVVVIGAARFAVEHADEYEGIPIQNWVYPQDREAGFYDFGVTDGIMRFFETNIGEYPYEKLANVQSKTRYGGMENASNIFYSENAISGTRNSEGLVAHEVAHQWFGNSVTEIDWPHIWLSEGFATYFTQLYMEHTYGRQRLIEGIQQARNSVLGFYQRCPDVPLVNPNIDDPNQHLNSNSYQKGAWVLHMLRRTVGDEAFWNGIRDYYTTYRDRNASSQNFQASMEAASGKDLDIFFQQWLYRPGQPILEGTWSHDAAAGNVSITLAQAQQGPIFSFPLEIGLVNADGETMITTLQVNERTETFSINATGSVSRVLLDPDVWLLFAESSWEKG